MNISETQVNTLANGLRIKKAHVKKIKNKKWRLARFHKLNNKLKETKPLIMNGIQRGIFKTIKEIKQQGIPLRIVILKPRQIGITTMIANYNLDKVIWRYNQFCAIVGHNHGAARTIFGQIVKFAWDHFPSLLRTKTRYDSTNQIFWESKSSQIIVTSDLHGLTPNLLHITEVARMRNAKEMLGEGFQSVPISGEIIMESTANGRSNYFFDHWQETEDSNGKNGWLGLFIRWWDHEEYRLAEYQEEIAGHFKKTDEEKEIQAKYNIPDEALLWRRWKIDESGGSRVDLETGLSGITIFKQNYPVNSEEAFIVLAGSLFDTEILYKMLLRCPNDDEILRQQQVGVGQLKAYHRKNFDRDYIISVDTSEGTGQDFSVATVIDPENLQVIGILRGKYRPKDLARYLAKLGRFYNHATLAIERNNHGHAVIEALENLDYPDIYYWLDKKYGFPMTKVTRTKCLADLEDAIANEIVNIPDVATIRECLNFGYNKAGKAEALKGHDDCVLALSIGVRLATQARTRRSEIDIKNKPPGL